MPVIITNCNFKNCGVITNTTPDKFENCEVNGVVFTLKDGFYFGKCKKCDTEFKLKSLDNFKCC